MFNQRREDGVNRVPVLAICVKNNPVIFFRKKEMIAIREYLPQLLQQAEEVKRRIRK